MTVKEFIGTLESSDRLRIIEGGADVYVGYLAAFKRKLSSYAGCRFVVIWQSWKR